MLNNNFRTSRIQFTLRNTTRTVDANWGIGSDEIGMKTALRQGTQSTLNLYFLDEVNPASGSNGQCYFPWQLPGHLIRDGCRIQTSTMPHGSNPTHNEGNTATHEVGHWFGLLHTFGNGCDDAGDGVEDTPTEASAAFGCNDGRDSCPLLPGLDPVHNYMDYSDEYVIHAML